jgi:hypothetical protein
MYENLTNLQLYMLYSTFMIRVMFRLPFFQLNPVQVMMDDIWASPQVSMLMHEIERRGNLHVERRQQRRRNRR